MQVRDGVIGGGVGLHFEGGDEGGLGPLDSISAESARYPLQVQTLIEIAALKIHPETFTAPFLAPKKMC
jgi:hypothetical protein